MRKSVQMMLVSALLLSAFVMVQGNPQCLSKSGQKVDWFIALKLPNGANYAYCDSTNCSSLTIQSGLLTDIDSPLMRTLQQVQNISSSEYGVLMWNDQPPTQTVSSTYAHAKGVLAAGKDQGFLLVHSTPKFPEIADGKISLLIQPNQQIYGQHFFCSSTTTNQLDSIAAAYTLDWPFVYGGNVPDVLKGYAYFSRMLSNIRDNESNQKTVNYTTLTGAKMIKFSKSGKWAVPFYDNVAAANLKTSLFVESWGSPQEDPDCSNSGQTVVSNVSIFFEQQNLTYKWTKDHSKYAISADSSKPYVCLGDINRQTSQWKRGGGTVCFENAQVYNNFKKIMVQQQDCSAQQK